MREVDVLEVGTLDKRCHFGLCTIAAVTELHIRAVAADLEVDWHAQIGMQAETFGLFAGILEHF